MLWLTPGQPPQTVRNASMSICLDRFGCARRAVRQNIRQARTADHHRRELTGAERQPALDGVL
jgi:hypothetical protein